MARILISGDRNWACRSLATRIVQRLIGKYGDDLVLVHGACTGVDMEFELDAKLAHVQCEAHPAKWYDLDVPGAVLRKNKSGQDYNANAGPARNQEMIDSGVAYCIAVHKDLKNSKGTRNCVELCLKAKIRGLAYDYLFCVRRGKETRRTVQVDVYAKRHASFLNPSIAVCLSGKAFRATAMSIKLRDKPEEWS